MRKRECTFIVMLYSCVKFFMFDNSSIINFLFFMVLIVCVSKFGVSVLKFCNIVISYVFFKIFCVFA